MLRMPDFNNVYGIVACDDLQTVVEAVQRALPWEQAYIKTSGYSGARMLRLRSNSAWFDSDPLDDKQHLLYGAAGG